MQITVAICDDEKEICAQIENCLMKLQTKKDIKCEIDVFYNGRGLCEEMARTIYDLVFLDIELPDKSGVEVGSYIRETLKNEIVQIAYISSKKQYAMELFEYRPINFLLKPLNEEAVEKVVDKYLIVTEKDTKIFTYKKGYDYCKIPLAQVLYFRSEGRRVFIKNLNGEEESFYGSLDSVYSSVKTDKFLYIHKSVIVNYRYIKIINYEQVTMINGEEFSISQARRKTIRDMLFEIKKREMEWKL